MNFGKGISFMEMVPSALKVRNADKNTKFFSFL